MTIAWEDPAYSGGFSVLTFKVYVDNNFWADLDPSKNTLQLTGLLLGTQYKVQVSSLNEVGESALSPSARITFANRPAPPASLALTSTALPSISAAWAAPAQANGDPISGYRLYIDNAAGGEETLAFDGSLGQPATYSWTLTNSLSCGAMYTLRVTAFNVAGESDGTAGQIKVGDPPSAPLHPRRTAITPLSSLTIAWDDSLSDGCLAVLHHVISRDGTDLPSLADPGANSFTDDISSAADFPLGTQITYTVKAVNAAGESDPSVALVVTVGQVPNAPSGVVIVRRFSETSVELQWAAGAEIPANPPSQGFRVYVDDMSGNVVKPLLVDTAQAVVSDLVLGQSYQVTVSAMSSIGEGALSSPALDLHTGLVPWRLAGLSAPRLAASTATSITLGWLPPTYSGGARLVEYLVHWDIGQTGTFASVALAELGVPTYTLDPSSPGAAGLTTGDLVDFYVTSVNIIGEAEASDIVTLYVAAVPAQPSAPIEAQVFSIPDAPEYGSQIGILVEWAAPADNGAPLRGYKLYWAEEQNPLQLIYDGSTLSRPDITSFTVREGITKSLYYKFRVQAVNAVGASVLSDELLVPATVAPSAPRDLAVTGSGIGTVSVAWSAPREAGGAALSGYYFYYQTPAALAIAPDAWLKSVLVSPGLSQYALGGLAPDSLYKIKMVAENPRGESAFSSSVSQYASAVPSALAPLSVVAGSRTASSLGIRWAAPGVSSTDVLGFRLYVNEPDSGAVPSKLAYDGEAISSLLEARVAGLESARSYWFSYQARNRAGWSSHSSPYLRAVAGPLP